nr:hypothetical protein [Tanacetum cinerariifolium]
MPETDLTEPPPAPLRNKEYEASPPRHQKERRERDSRRPPVFTRIGKRVVGDQTADLQYLGTHENNGWRTNVHAKLGSRDVHDRLGRRRSLSESPPSSDSKAREDDERHQESRQDRPDQIMLQHYGTIDWRIYMKL